MSECEYCGDPECLWCFYCCECIPYREPCFFSEEGHPICRWCAPPGSCDDEGGFAEAALKVAEAMERRGVATLGELIEDGDA